MQLYYLTQCIFLVNLTPQLGPYGRLEMKTKTYFIDSLESLVLGSDKYQRIENVTIKTKCYEGVIFSGSLFIGLLFEDNIFLNCTFFGTHLENCLFINCLFINCKFQFSKFSSCNFESTLWENCIWGLTLFKNTEITYSEASNNYSFESNQNESLSKALGLADFLNLSA